MAEPFKEIHGLSRVIKEAMIDDRERGQDVLVTDSDAHVRLSLSTSSYPAKLTPAEARWLAKKLVDSAARADAYIERQPFE